MTSRDAPSAKAVLQQTFDTVSVGYDRDVLRFFRDAAQRLAASLALRGDEHVLDVATGTGHAALSIARRLPRGRVTAVDFSAGMLAQARRKAAVEGARNVEWLEMDMSDLAFPAETFDVVVCAFGLFFCEDMDAALGSMATRLKHGGTMAVLSFHETYFSPLRELMTDRLQRRGVPSPPQTWRRIANADLCAEMFGRAGFTRVRVEQWDCGYPLATADDWWDVIWNAGFRRMVCQLSGSDQEQFRREHLAEVDALRTPEGIRLAVDVLCTQGTRERQTGSSPPA